MAIGDRITMMMMMKEKREISQVFVGKRELSLSFSLSLSVGALAAMNRRIQMRFCVIMCNNHSPHQ